MERPGVNLYGNFFKAVCFFKDPFSKCMSLPAKAQHIVSMPTEVAERYILYFIICAIFVGYVNLLEQT